MAQNFCPHASIMLQVHCKLFLTLAFLKISLSWKFYYFILASPSRDLTIIWQLKAQADWNSWKKYFITRVSRFEEVEVHRSLKFLDLPLFLFPSVTSGVTKKREEEIKKKNELEMRKEKCLGPGNSKFFSKLDGFLKFASWLSQPTLYKIKVWLNSLHYAKLELVQLSPGVCGMEKRGNE